MKCIKYLLESLTRANHAYFGRKTSIVIIIKITKHIANQYICITKSC